MGVGGMETGSANMKRKTNGDLVLVPMAAPAVLPGTITDVFAVVLDGLDSPHSKRAYGRALAEFHAWWMGGGKGAAYVVDYNAVAKWRAELVEGGRLSPQSINQRLAAVRAMVRALAVRGYLSWEAATAICTIKSVKAKGVRMGNWLSRVEVEKLLAAPDVRTVAGVRNAAMLRLMLSCGLRREDVAKLRGVDLAMVGGRWVLLNIVGKGRRVGTIPVAGWAADAVHKWWEVRGVWAGIVAGSEVLPMFTTVRPGADPTAPIGVQTVADVVKHYGVKIGKPQLRAHDLRRTFAEQANADGGDLHQIQMSLRHSDLSTTAKYLGDKQDLQHAPCDALKWDVPAVDISGVRLGELTFAGVGLVRGDGGEPNA